MMNIFEITLLSASLVVVGAGLLIYRRASKLLKSQMAGRDRML
jgi:hypothetical protein